MVLYSPNRVFLVYEALYCRRAAVARVRPRRHLQRWRDVADNERVVHHRVEARKRVGGELGRREETLGGRDGNDMHDVPMGNARGVDNQESAWQRGYASQFRQMPQPWPGGRDIRRGSGRGARGVARARSQCPAVSSTSVAGSQLTAGWSGLPGPGERITQSVFGRTSCLNVALRSIFCGNGVNAPVIFVALDHDDLAQHVGIRVQLREEDEEVVGVCRQPSE